MIIITTTTPTMVAIASVTEDSQSETHKTLYMIIAAIAAIAVMGSVFLLRVYFCGSSERGESYDEECQDPTTRRKRRLKSLVEEKTLRAEYKDYKLLQRSRMSTMVSSFDEGSLYETSAEADSVITGRGMASSMFHLENDDDAEELYPSGKMGAGRATECAVCLGEYKSDDLVCELECGHVFHEDCLFKWFLRSGNAQCPLCRYNLEDESNPLPPPPLDSLQSEDGPIVGLSRLNNV
ncbi:conserved hypothetical protein [Perkinsus marinus ATCC 50983]|uniref:RING-type domain-containing protein n=1 Tax=Perkinsus marinus (strain ATCC 50983 / TXsc) TaxID=423536 RepID=C5KB91_PERM5|nr:conserved hypothetical protein [Perkinsus marinus ATCC 50983]EER18417.1 conserved hypothetical protein [Perkinsus marinus ATCC 50983]|eukprot:XP_002786621.1 conserved hypothetical protein [Perkinsus marinus ATCC 50983]